MLKKGKTAEEIAEFCGYPVDTVKAVEEKLGVMV